jgi:hypothetical protein
MNGFWARHTGSSSNWLIRETAWDKLALSTDPRSGISVFVSVISYLTAPGESAQ